MKERVSHRNVGLDLLRCFAMFGIIALHLLGHGGLLEQEFTSANGALLWLTESIFYFAVDVFVLISGYFLCDGKFKISKVLRLILEITFWGIVCYLLSIILGGNFSLVNAIKSFLPWFFGVYWFPTVYLGLYILSPFINSLVNILSRIQYTGLILVVLTVSCMPFLSSTLKISGMSLAWFVALYLVGAYLKRYPLKLRSWVYFVAIVASIIVLFATKAVSLSVMETVSSFVWNYSSIVCLIGAVSLFELFKKIHLFGTVPSKIISVISSATFGIYLIHDNMFLRDRLWLFVNKIFAFSDTPVLLLKVFLAIISVFLVSFVLEYIRVFIFKLIHADKACDFMGKKIENWHQSIISKNRENND